MTSGAVAASELIKLANQFSQEAELEIQQMMQPNNVFQATARGAAKK